MTVYTDLHIHSALSPCSDADMTPNNIINMAVLKNLDIIAVTDHNSTKNLPALYACAKDKKITLVCGMEIETAEEVHMIALFGELEGAMAAGEAVYKRLSGIKNNPAIFGRQLVFDKDDTIIAEEEKLLLTATDIGMEELIKLVPQYGGVVYPAHIDRNSYSVISNLGFIPPDWGLKTVEVSRRQDKKTAPDLYGLSGYRIITASDAHNLGDMFEDEGYINLKENSKDALFDYVLGVTDEG